MAMNDGFRQMNPATQSFPGTAAASVPTPVRVGEVSMELANLRDWAECVRDKIVSLKVRLTPVLRSGVAGTACEGQSTRPSTEMSTNLAEVGEVLAGIFGVIDDIEARLEL